MIDHRLGIVAALAAVLASCDNGTKPPEGPSPMHVLAGGKRIDVTLVATEKARRHATASFGALPPGKGYLMAWPRERFCKIESRPSGASFDVAFLDRAGRILDLRALAAGHPEGIQPSKESAYALFVAPGSADLKTGDSVQLSADVRAAAPQELPVVRIGEHTAYVELSLTMAERSQGLMFRSRLSENDGMLFAYDREGLHSFWMGNTLIPLDIAFFSADGTLLNVCETPTYPDPRNPPQPYATADAAAPARFVLEMNLGWFRKRGLLDAEGKPKPGTRAVFPPEAMDGSP